MFVRTVDEVRSLPSQERAVFLPAITTGGIANGRIERRVLVFYPYKGNTSLFESEEELKNRLPNFYRRVLLPNRDELIGRVRVGQKWWELSEKRSTLLNERPVFVTKYWASVGGVALHTQGSLLLQAYGWVPTGRLEPHLHSTGEAELPDITAAYLAILNSRTFFDLVAEHAPPAAGGQRDMSPDI